MKDSHRERRESLVKKFKGLRQRDGWRTTVVVFDHDRVSCASTERKHADACHNGQNNENKLNANNSHSSREITQERYLSIPAASLARQEFVICFCLARQESETKGIVSISIFQYAFRFCQQTDYVHSVTINCFLNLISIIK